MIWGPDGWLYGCNGIQTKSYVGKPDTPKDKRIFFDCGVWRFHPTKKVFEVVANGTTNPFGLDFDENGEMFITNCVIDHLFHIVPGGHYTRMYGNDPNPYVYGAMGSCVDYKHWGSGAWTDSRADQKTGALKKEHDDAGGGHAHSGCMIYQAENFPKEYRNTLFTCNIHGNRLNNDGLERTKTGMKGVRRPDFLFANDPWFRGICVKQGPAGELFVSDWSDTGECHNYQVVDASNGRIFRVTYGDLKPFSGDLSKWSNDELAKAVISSNEWLSRKARRLLMERCIVQNIDITSAVHHLRKAHAAATTVAEQLRITWALHGMQELRLQEIQAMVEKPIGEAISIWALRLAAEAYFQKETPELILKSSFIKSDLMSQHLYALTRLLEPDQARRVLENVLVQPDASPKTWLMNWFAVENLLARSDEHAAIAWIGESHPPLTVQFAVRRYLANPTQDRLDRVVALIPNTVKLRQPLLLGLREALGNQTNLKLPAVWSKVDYNKSSPDIRQLADEIALAFGDPEVISVMKQRCFQSQANATDRSRSVSLLAGRKVPGFQADLQKLLTDPTVRQAAIIGLANYNDANTPKLILDIYSKLTPEEKADAVTTLASRGTYATALLDAVEKGTIPKTDITAFTARQIAALKDKDVVAKLEKVWGKVQPASANRKALMDKYKSILTLDSLASADAGKGKAVFVKNCATCHKMYGEGQNVGPELTGSQRSNLDYILENVVDPSAVVAKEYQMTNYYLLDGRIVSGIVKQDTPNSVTVRTVNEEVVIPKADIESKKATTLSVMPEGLLDVLKPEDVRNLVKYLMSKEQVK